MLNIWHDDCSMQKEAHVIETREFLAEDKTKPRGSIRRSIANLWRILWWRFLFCHKTDSKNKHKHK